MEEYRSEVISGIRSCLISTKGMITVRQLEDDYRTLLGEKIPFKKLGHPSLENFLQSIPTVITSRSSQGELLVDAKVSEKSAHISSMVHKQKSSAPKKKVRSLKVVGPRKTPPVSQKWRPKGGFTKKSVKSEKLEKINHHQFVNGPSVASKIVVPEGSQYYNNERKEAKETKRNDAEVDPLSSTMRRLSKIMSEMSMERDSGNSSPTTEDISCKEFLRTGDAITDLRNFAAYHKLGEIEVKFTETKVKKSRNTQYHCKITVGQHKYSSYPEDFFDEPSAESHASQRALDDLSQKYSKRRSLLLSSSEDIFERIPPMLEKHSGAVWMWQIEADYTDKYNEQLPTDWLQIIDNSPFVSIEKCTGGCLLKHCNPNDVMKNGKKGESNRLNIGDVSVPCNTATFEEENRLYAIITSVSSAGEIWCQQIGISEYSKFLRISDLMDRFYNSTPPAHPSILHVGSCYAVKHEGGWFRARSLTESTFFLIDYGEEIEVHKSDIYLLQREFAMEQAQAFVCKLAGLEDFYDFSVNSDSLNNLIGKQVILELVTENEREDVSFPVVMYDVTDGKSLNERLILSLTVESAIPVLDKKSIMEVYVSNIESNSDIYVQLHSYGFQRLLDLLTEFTPPTFYTPPIRSSPPDRIYLIREEKSQSWQRATILDWAPSGDLTQIYFIDVGNTLVVNVKEKFLYPIDGTEQLLREIPPQAIKVRMMLDRIPVDFLKRAERLLPLNQSVLLKVCCYDSENVPWVELFKRTNDDVLVFVNKSISVEDELQNFDLTNNNNESTKKRLLNLVGEGTKNVPSGGHLKKPKLPKLGDYFNVDIPFSVNPWNFFIQPLDSRKQLQSLMADMQEFYKDIQFTPIPIQDIVPGNIYASKHEDGHWYRTSVLKVIHSGSISVFYCDFGYYTSLTITQLVPLESKYLSLPYQAVKAKIAGIRPVNDKWTMEDCNFFNNLVMKKHFVSILVNIEKDEFYKSDNVLQLLLIDTSKEEDVNIKELLIKKGIATTV